MTQTKTPNFSLTIVFSERSKANLSQIGVRHDSDITPEQVFFLSSVVSSDYQQPSDLLSFEL